MRPPEVQAEIRRLVDESTVLIRGDGSGGRASGSGFFAAPGTVISCAHVVGVHGRAGNRATVSWNGHEMPATVRAVPPDHTDERLWGYPDLALIEIDEPPANHPWVWLEETPPTPSSDLYAVGYSTVYTSQPGLSRALVRYVGPQDFDPGTLLRVKDDELADGMSGGPVLDPVQGGVCGVIKTSRKSDSPSGGLVIPSSAIAAHFPKLAQAARPARWGDLRMALRHATASRGLLSSDEETDLLTAIAVAAPNLYALFRSVVGELRPAPTEPLLDGADLIRELADSMDPAPGEAHPLVRLCDVLARRSSAPESARLRTLARAVARRTGQGYDPADAGQGSEMRHSSAIEIHLASYAPNRQRHLLTIWAYDDVRRCPAQLFCDDRPLTLREVRSRVKAVLPRAVAELQDADELTVEFTLPHRLVHEAVDEWDLGTKEVTLGSRFPVIVRIGDRPPGTEWHWRRRWESLHAGQAENAALLTWIDCRAESVFRKLYGSLQLDEKLAVLAACYQPKPDVLKALVHAGIPVALWPRRIGADHGGHVRCAGEVFHDDFTKHFAERPLRELPLLVKKVRTEAIRHDDDHYGRALTLLWDDPTRPRPDQDAVLGAPR